jgi:D-glycero-D-manno-heptose 1,7-bisphosphate phosphatase
MNSTTVTPHVSSGVAAVFLDRDGTLIDEVGYLDRPERVVLYPWSIAAIRALNRSNIRTVMVTNQSGVARGFFDEALVERVHRHIAGQLEAGGAYLDRYYYCPHHPDGRVAGYARACDCRKPGRGLIDRAVEELGVDPRQSFTVGDRWLDVALAGPVGAQGILVRTGYGALEEARRPDHVSVAAVVNNLIEAVGWILSVGAGGSQSGQARLASSDSGPAARG